ncbi:MAG: ThuA domain-containing protein [Bacteroidota bacterium]
MKKIVILIGFILCFGNICHTQHLLIFTKTQKFRHKSIPAGQQMFIEMARSEGWTLTFSEDATIFNTSFLNQLQGIVFLSTTGDILNEQQQKAFQAFIRSGGAFIGIHAASDTEKEWPWYHNLLGAQFKNHPKVQEAEIQIINSNHPIVAGLPQSWIHRDEWYNFGETVKAHINTLAQLNEDSYTGGNMDNNHPISWYHIFDGGRVFYTGLGHTSASFRDTLFQKHILQGIEWTLSNYDTPLSEGWQDLLDENLSHWDKFLGVPHHTTPLDSTYEKGDGMRGAPPLGLNNDPLNVFSIKMENDQAILAVSGQMYGGLSTKEVYQNYHLQLQFKWGDKKYEPRLDRKRDSGILYHCTGQHGKFWNVWMRSQEFQVQEGDCGDYFALSGVSMEIKAQKPKGSAWIYDPSSPKRTFGNIKGAPGRCRRSINHELPKGEWNTLDLYCFEGTSIHLVNGKLVNYLEGSSYLKEGEKIPLSSGKIQLQSEGAEVYYKNIRIRAIEKADLPK